MTAQIHRFPTSAKWVPPKSPQHGDCELIMHSIRQFYAVSEEEIRNPGISEPRRVAVVIATNIGIPRDVVTDYFNIGTPGQITLWQLALSERAVRDRNFGATFAMMERFCRRATHRTIFTEPIDSPQSRPAEHEFEGDWNV